MSSTPPPSAAPISPDDEMVEPILSASDRGRVLSALGIKLKLAIFVVAVLALLGGAMVGLVTRIFAELTPSIEKDLRWKVERGVQDVATRIQYEILVGDAEMAEHHIGDYLTDPDVVGLVVTDVQGKRLLSHGIAPDLHALQTQPEGVSHDFLDTFGAWKASEIEGAKVGFIGLSISKARILAGKHLRVEMMVATTLGAVVAMLFCLLFVNLYIGPVLALTAEAFARLEATTENALEVARLKSQFLANMSHEIRTPMNGILGMLTLLKRTKQSATQVRYTHTIENSSRALLGIIDDILDFSKLEAGKLKLRPSEFELSELLQELAELLAPKAHEKHIELIIHQDQAVPNHLRADQDRLRQVLTNLIGNAIKFTESGYVAVHVTVDALGEDQKQVMLAFAVEDTGLGIAREDQNKLFQSFSQVDGSLTRAHGGTGLGLAISKHLSEAMGGQIGLSSDLGQGSTFFFTVSAVALEDTHNPLSSQPPRPAQVLIISSNTLQRTQLEQLLTAWGMHVVALESGAAGSRFLTSEEGLSQPRDVVIVDIPVGDRDGTYRELTDLCAVEDMPVLCIASEMEPLSPPIPGSRRLAIPKPVRPSNLYDGLVGLLEGTLTTSNYTFYEAATSSPAISVSPPSPPLHGLPILVVDDNAINRTVAVELLTEMGYPTETASNGLEAVQRVANNQYAAVLMDCQMPVLDGYQAVERIRKLPTEAAHTPVIALTAHALSGDRERVLSAGMNDYMTKPIKARTLERKLAQWLHAAQALPSAAGHHASSWPTSATESVHALPSARSLPVLDPETRRPAKAIELFISSMRAEAQTLRDHVHNGSPEQVRAQAHRMKGACLSLGVNACAAACRDIENRARMGAIDHERIQQVPAMVNAAIEALTQQDSGYRSAEGA